MFSLCMRVHVNVSNSMYVFATTQVSCLGLEENVENDPCKFTVTSRLTNGTVESFVLHSTHPGVCEVWTLRISQILESQRNFLNGILTNKQTQTYRRDMSHKKIPNFCLTNRVSEEPCGGHHWTPGCRKQWAFRDTWSGKLPE